MVSEHERTLCFCINYWNLQVVTVQDSYHIPRMHDHINSLGDILEFYRLYVDADRDKSPFASDHGPCRLSRMPLGFSNQRSTFRRRMDLILSPIDWELVQLYLFDTIISYSNKAEYISDVCTLLSVLLEVGVTLILNTCSLLTSKFENFGHIVRPENISCLIMLLSRIVN